MVAGNIDLHQGHGDGGRKLVYPVKTVVARVHPVRRAGAPRFAGCQESSRRQVVSSKLFSNEWMAELAGLWNSDPKMTKNLAKADFSAYIGYGFTGEENPRGFIYVDGGKVVAEGVWDGEDLNWDLRASRDSWKKWLKEGFGLLRLGKAVTSGELKFNKGDYRVMVSNVKLSIPFLRHLELMAEIKTDFNV